MNKLPVGRTIRDAYAFTFGQIGTIIGLIWIPTLINAVASFVSLEIGQEAGGGTGAPGAFLLYMVVALVLVAMMAVAVTKQVLGIRKGPAVAYFALGRNEWHVIGGIGILYLLAMGFALVVGLLGAVVSAAGGAVVTNESVSLALMSTIGLVAFGAILFVFVRLSFLFVPAAVNEGDFGISRSWQLTKGNFWRIFAVGLAMLLPLILIQGVAQYLIIGPEYFLSIGKIMNDPQNLARYQAEQAEIVRRATPALLGVGLILAPLAQGMLWAPAAFAYRVLSGKAIVADSDA